VTRNNLQLMLTFRLSRHIPWQYLIWCHDHSFLHNFQFIIQCHPIVYSI